MTTPFAALGMAAGGAALSGLAYAISKRAAREAIVRWHSTVTVAAGTIALTGTMIAGTPRPWIDIILGGGALFAVSWNLRRFDAMRSDTHDRDESDSWGKVLGMPKTRPGKPKAVGARVEVPLFHGEGETIRNAQHALPAIESARGIPAGRSRVVADPDNAGRSTLVMVEHDVLKDTIPWPGPSAPGGSIALGLKPGVYEDDQVVVFWLTATSGKDSRPSTHLMLMGMTRSGKSRAGLVNAAEILTRRDVVLFWADAAKGAQVAGSIQGGLTLYANDVRKVRALLKGLRSLVRFRADAMGQHGFADWTPDVYAHPKLRMPLVVVQLEEADEYIQTDEYRWLASKALSAGVILCTSLQRADHSSMPTNARFNLGAAMCFGTGDDYSAAFALSEATIAAGAHPENWKAARQGYFYLEAPGIDVTRYPVPARAYYATDTQIADVIAAYAHQRATLDPASQQALGQAWELCQPNTSAAATAGRPSPRPRPAPAVMDDDFDEDDDPSVFLAELDQLQADVADEIAAEFPRLDDDGRPMLPASAKQPVPAFTGLDAVWGSDRPAEPLDQSEAETAFDDVLRALAVEGKTTITVAEIVDRYPYRSRTWLSRRLSAVAEGAIVAPPGLGLERGDDAGSYTLHHLAAAH